ncbi:glycosyltransferase [Parapedobacter sp. SGR-10]|uniref:glycosyltransferase family 2 protein n=1 Tax=Parapedobacter sp. SGR-10 TaxID=2710879 RepID=UPI0013D1A9A3|nr:glycosyltransferase family 2 protein [Parapedobacter sp. SGR-10]NGF56306.1 glycosyltransferase [Parapedobacter sp. SGR-10]
MNVKFSVITINYNNAQGLVNTIKSVIEQDYKNFEYIIIDGGSTDGSTEIITQYQNHIDYSVSEKDNGIYHAINKGIKAASGDYVIFMNSGDRFYDTHTLTAYVDNITSSEYGVYYGNSIGLFQSNNQVQLKQPEDLNLSFWFFNSLSHQATAINRKLFDVYGLYDENMEITSDWQYFVELFLLRNVKFKYIDRDMAYYDMHGISSDPAMAAKNLNEREIFIKERLPQFWEEYTILKELRSPTHKRQTHFEYIQTFPFAYRILKSFMDLILLFLPSNKEKK